MSFHGRLLAVTVMAVLGLACGGAGNQADATAAVGEPIAFDDWTATVHGSSTTAGVGKLVKHTASEGAELLLVDLTAENTGDRPMAVGARVVLEDMDGRRFKVTPRCMVALEDKLGGLEQIQPGLKKRGKLCFEVPKDLTLRLGVRPHMLGGVTWVEL